MMNKTPYFRKLTITPIVIWLILFALAPFILLLVISFFSHTDSQLFTLPLTFKNYTQLLHPIYFKILLQSLQLAFITTILCLILGYPVAYYITRLSKKWQPLLLILIIIPLWTSSLIRTYGMIAILKTKGLLNTLLLSLGIIHDPFLLLYSNIAVLIGMVYNLLPFMILPLYANIEKLDHRLLEAARDLGAKRTRLFIRIIFPLTLPGIIAGSLIVFLPAMTLFYIPTLLGGAKSILLGNLIQSQFLEMRNWPAGSATSIILTIFLLLLLIPYRYIKKYQNRTHGNTLL